MNDKADIVIVPAAVAAKLLTASDPYQFAVQVKGYFKKYVEPTHQDMCHFNQQGNGDILVKKHPNDSLNFPSDSGRKGECRYTFAEGPGGVLLGTLKPDAANLDAPAPVEIPTP